MWPVRLWVWIQGFLSFLCISSCSCYSKDAFKQHKLPELLECELCKRRGEVCSKEMKICENCITTVLNVLISLRWAPCPQDVNITSISSHTGQESQRSPLLLPSWQISICYLPALLQICDNCGSEFKNNKSLKNHLEAERTVSCRRWNNVKLFDIQLLEPFLWFTHGLSPGATWYSLDHAPCKNTSGFRWKILCHHACQY